MQTSSRALYSSTSNSATEKCEARANEWRFTTFDLRLSPFRVDLDGLLYTLVALSYPAREIYWRKSRLTLITRTLFTCQEFRSSKTGQRAQWFYNFPSSVFDAQDAIHWFKLYCHLWRRFMLVKWNSGYGEMMENLWQFITYLNFSDVLISELPQRTVQTLVSNSDFALVIETSSGSRVFLSDDTGLRILRPEQ
jgi:hypothetical protein